MGSGRSSRAAWAPASAVGWALAWRLGWGGGSLCCLWRRALGDSGAARFVGGFVLAGCVCGALARLGPPRAGRPCSGRLLHSVCVCAWVRLLLVVWPLWRSWPACLLFCWVCAFCRALCGILAGLVFPVALCLVLITDSSVVPPFSVTHFRIHPVAIAPERYLRDFLHARTPRRASLRSACTACTLPRAALQCIECAASPRMHREFANARF